MKRIQAGFSVIELLFILVIVMAIGGVGYFVYHSHYKPSASSAAKQDAIEKTLSSVQEFQPISSAQFGDTGNVTTNPQPVYPNVPSKVGSAVNHGQYQGLVTVFNGKTKIFIGKLNDSSKGFWQLVDSFEIVDNALNANYPAPLLIKSNTIVEWTNLPSNSHLAQAVKLYNDSHYSIPSMWSTVTFTPENIKLNIPDYLVKANYVDSYVTNRPIKQPTELSPSIHDSSYMSYATALDNGYTLNIVIIKNPSSYKGYSNLEPATQQASFKEAGNQFYIVLNNDGNYLMISTCANKVCTYSAHNETASGVLIFISYNGAKYSLDGSYSMTDKIYLGDKFTPTIMKILESLRY